MAGLMVLLTRAILPIFHYIFLLQLHKHHQHNTRDLREILAHTRYTQIGRELARKGCTLHL